MGNNLKKKYGLLTAMAMVIGIVIGSGVFFKAEKVLVATGGNLPLGILAWCIGGAIMVICAYTFAVMATRYEKVNGIVDYAEVTCGKTYAYFVGWFMTTIYYPCLTGILAWVSARYVGVLFNLSITGGEVMVIAGFFLIASYAMNALSPIIAGKFQVSTTIIKLVPLLLMAVVGTIVGLVNGLTIENFTTVVDPSKSTSGGLMMAVVATAFAYEGWIIATSINSELKDSKKNLPIALVLGTFIIMLVYILYYVGLSGAVTNAELMAGGETGAKIAFTAIFGKVGGTILMFFVVISCLGTLNGLMLGCTRGMYSIAVRNRGPRPEIFKVVDKTTDMPSNSSIVGLLLCGVWLLYFYGANLTPKSWFGPFTFDNSELPIVTIYLFFIPIFVKMIMKEKNLGKFNRFVMPSLSIVASITMIIASIIAHKWANLFYFIVFLVIMGIGWFFRKEKTPQEELQDKQENK
ncbi:MAG: APC family permease [Clostridia bacterium]